MRALADAADAALVLGDATAAARIAALRDAMRADLHASIALAMAQHGIDFVPGSAELARLRSDLDRDRARPLRRGVAAAARGARAHLRALLAGVRGAARAARIAPDAYTPYEIRNAVALLRLGWKERALALLAWLIGDQRPPAWRQWPEVSTRDPRAPRFLGDLPHGWVASSFVRALRRLVAYERDDDGALVVAAGIPEAWVREAPGVRVRGLPTHFGVLDLELARRGRRAACARASAAAAGRPAGWCSSRRSHGRCAPSRSTVARSAVDDPQRVALRELPSEVVLRYAP